jgi:hypothetical protein
LSRIDSPFPRKPISWPQIYLAVALTTLATLVLELSLTRLFSVVFYYHFAFLAISIALFGLGAGGVLSYLLKGGPGKSYSKLGVLSTINAAAVPAALVFLLTRDKQIDNVTLGLVYFACAIPFIISGAVVASAIAQTIERVERVYFFDLIGAAGGCLLLVPFLNTLGGPNTLIAAGVLFAAAGAIWFHIEGRIQGRAASVLLALALTSLVVLNFKEPVVEVKTAKGMDLPREIFTKWNSFSRIGLNPENNWIVIDADASTAIANYDFDRLSPEDRQTLLSQGPGLVYRIRPGGKTLVIGAGGGYDVARALASGSREVTAVEINRIIAHTIMRERFPHLSRRLYFRPEIRLVIEDGRSFVRRDQEKYQVLQATLVDTWASTAAGAFALTENNLYTVEAFRDYLERLTGDGMLSFTRWGFDPPRESLRLLALAREALAQLGENEPWRHVIVARENASQIHEWGATDTVIISRKPFAAFEQSRLIEAVRAAQLTPVYLPGFGNNSEFGRLLTSPDPALFYGHYRYDVSPVTDNRPFFFYTVQPRDLIGFLQNADEHSADYKVNRAVPLLFGLVGISVIATLITLALPPLLLRTQIPAEAGMRRFLLYFVAIGAGYILVQVALIQKFVLFLGQPAYALTVIIFSMLVSSGFGSFSSKRLVAGSGQRWMRALAAIAALVALLSLTAGPVTTAGVGWPLWIKAPVSVLLILPAGFVMGVPFPTGLAYLEKRQPAAVRWAWSLNAASSVMGSACAIFFALYLGLQQTLLLGGALYLAALLVVRREGVSDSRAGFLIP